MTNHRFTSTRRCLKFCCGGALLWLTITFSMSATDFLVFFGTYTNALSQGIYVSRLDADTGKLSAPELAAATPSPSFVAISPNGKFLYAANSVSAFEGKPTGAISAFAIDRGSGRLSFLNAQSSAGSDPCHVSVDAKGRILLAANYNTGSFKSFSLEKNGSIGAEGALIEDTGSSVNPSRQTGPHAHFIATDPSNRYALACDLGTDKVMIFKLAAGGLDTNDTSFASVPPGSGPRHVAFSRDGRFVHVINEMACTVTTFAWDPRKGALSAIETVPALPVDVPVQSNFTAAEIRVHPSGKFVYATIRGSDSVSVFAADPQSGRLTLLQNISAGGKMPRGLGVDPTGHWLIVGNQKTDNAVEFTIDPLTGQLLATGQELKIGSPVDVEFMAAK